MSPDQSDVLSEAEIAEIRSSARSAAAASRPAHRVGYRPSFEALVETPVMGPVLFPIPGAAEPQKQPWAVPRRAAPIALVAVAAGVAIVALGRGLSPSSWPWGSSARQTFRLGWTARAPEDPVEERQAPRLAPHAATASTDEPPVVAEPAPAAVPQAEAELVATPTVGVRATRRRSALDVQPAAAQEPAPSKPVPADHEVTAADTREVRGSPELTAVQPRRDDRTVDQLLDSVVQSQPRGQQEVDIPEKAPELPPLTRDQIKLAMKQIRPRIEECYRQHQQRGVAQVRIEVGNGGTINSAAVSGRPFAGTPTGDCVETAVKSVSLPASAGMTFHYPFPVR